MTTENRVPMYEVEGELCVWLCALCDAPLGEPHVGNCKCTLVEATPITDLNPLLEIEAQP